MMPTIRLRFSPTTPKLRARVYPGIPPLQAEFRNNGTALQWRVGASGTWTDIVDLVDITGPVAVVVPGTGIAVDSSNVSQPVVSLGNKAEARDYLDAASYVSTRTALKAIDTSKETVAYLTEAGREGMFVFRSGNYAALVTADTNETTYIKADDTATSAGAWVKSDSRIIISPGAAEVSGPSISIVRSALDGVATSTLTSVGQGAFFAKTTRKAGTGQYGNMLVHSIVDVATGAGEFDVGITAWSNHYNLTGGTIFGMWAGANTPSAALSETYSSGAAVGLEVNAGNRWSDFGLLSDVGATRYTVGLQIVPDVIPAADGATVAVYPGSFGTVISASVTGHKWWTGNLVRTDSIMAGGYVNRDNGGSVLGNAPLGHTKVSGYFTDGIDLSGATISGNAFKSYGFTVSGAGAVELGIVGSALGRLYFDGSTSGQTILQPAVAAGGTLTLPAATDTLVGKATTDTLTNKTLTSPVLTTPTLGVASASSLAVTATGAPTIGISAPAANTLGVYTQGLLTATFTSDASAVNYLQVSAKATGTGPFFVGNGTDTDVSLNFGSKGAGAINFYTDVLATFPVQFQVAHVAGATNYLTARGANAGAPEMLVTGASTNADMKLTPKGTGVLQMGNSGSFIANGSVATTMTSLGPTGSHTTIQEWLQIKNSGGTVRYIPLY